MDSGHPDFPRTNGRKYLFSPVHADSAQPLADDSDVNSADEILIEIGLVLVVVLGIVVAINAVLVGMHIGA